jgi:hydrogenase maturation protease
VKTILIGLGNPILGDDGVGWQIAQRIQHRSDFPSEIDVDYLSLGGISLMESLVGYDRAILVDTIITGDYPIGTVSSFNIEQLPNFSTGHSFSAHDTSLQSALKIGKDLGLQLPGEIIIVAVEAQRVYDFSEQLSPEVEAAIPKAVQTIINLLGG